MHLTYRSTRCTRYTCVCMCTYICIYMCVYIYVCLYSTVILFCSTICLKWKQVKILRSVLPMLLILFTKKRKYSRKKEWCQEKVFRQAPNWRTTRSWRQKLHERSSHTHMAAHFQLFVLPPPSCIYCRHSLAQCPKKYWCIWCDLLTMHCWSVLTGTEEPCEGAVSICHRRFIFLLLSILSIDKILGIRFLDNSVRLNRLPDSPSTQFHPMFLWNCS